MKEQVKSIAKSIVEEAKAKGRTALYRVSELIEIKKRLLDIRENVRGAIKTKDKDIAKTALLAKEFREAGQDCHRNRYQHNFKYGGWQSAVKCYHKWSWENTAYG